MKRYLLFLGDWHPCGGWRDFGGSFDSISEAQRHILRMESKPEWYHIVDSTNATVVTKLKAVEKDVDFRGE